MTENPKIPDIEEALDLIEDLLGDCADFTVENVEYNTMGRRTYVDAVDFLVKHGRMEVIQRFGRVVRAKLIPQEKRTP